MVSQYISERSVQINKTAGVFYNPAQKINRDISIMVINAFLGQYDSDGACIFEAMSATGLRGIRYAKEINKSCNVFMNDISLHAYNIIKSNLEANGVEYCAMNAHMDLHSLTKHKTKNSNKIVKNTVFLLNNDCDKIMASNNSFFHVIDIDPFGSFTKNLPFVFKSIKNNGLVCLTATDTAVLCKNRNKCYSKYGVLIRKVPYYSELALRTALSTVARLAAMYNCGITPLLSVSIDFYIRLFLKVEHKASSVKKTLADCSNYLICACGYTIELNAAGDLIKLTCPICEDKLLLCGPLWKGNLHQLDFVTNLKNTMFCNRVTELISLIIQENSYFGFYHIPSICSMIHHECIPMIKLVSELFNRGKKVSFTHCRANSIKTNTSLFEIIEIINQYFKDKDSIHNNELAINMCNRKYNREILHSNMGPLSKPHK